MNTPITDETSDYELRLLARRLERDRAVLIEALEQIKDQAAASWIADIARAAIAAARANFPEP